MDRTPETLVGDAGETVRTSYEALVAALQAPLTLDEFTSLLEAIEGELGDDEDDVVHLLIEKLRFYALILTAQHLLIRDLRRIAKAASIQ